MLMTAAQWNLRLENEYKAMCAFPINTLFSWKIANGQSRPRVRAYHITYNVKTKVKTGDRLRDQEKTEVLITMSDSPGGAPNARIVGGEIPYHPNIYSSGNFCLGDMWSKEPILWKLVINIGKVLAFDPAHTNPNSPANGEAATDWKRRQIGNKGPYPCGNINFPHPLGY